MHEAIYQRHGSEVVRNVLGWLADFTKIHFAVEESLVRILGYPDHEAHKLQHEALVEPMHGLQQKVESGKTAIGFALMHFLKVWLTKHIMESDRQYSNCFLNAGAKLKKKGWIARLRHGIRG